MEGKLGWYLQKFYMCISFDTEILLLGIYPAEVPTHATKHRQGMFTAILFVSKKERQKEAERNRGQGREKDRRTTGKGNGQQ